MRPAARDAPTAQGERVAGVAALLASVFVAAWSMVRRYRRARGLERQQLQWLALAAALARWRS